MVRPRRTGRGLGIPPRPPARAAFTFIAPRRLSCEPLTRARVRLLGPCFKTGRVGGRHRRGPRALASLATEARPPGPDGATRPGRTGDSPPRPDPPGWRRAGVGERSRRGRGGPAPPETPARAAPRGAPPSREAAPPRGGSAGRGGERGGRGLAPSAPGCGERCCRGAVTLGAKGGPAAVAAGPPRATFPAGLPSRPGAGRGAPPRWKCN